MFSVSVIGLGRVGSVLCSSIILSGVADKLYIYDKNIDIMLGNREDLMDMSFFVNGSIDIEIGVGESDVYVITAGKPRKAGGKFDYKTNFKIVKECVELCGKNKTILVATNPVDEICRKLKGMYDDRTIIPVGKLLDSEREFRTGRDSEDVANYILRTKGYTNFGCVGEIITILKIMKALR